MCSENRWPDVSDGLLFITETAPPDDHVYRGADKSLARPGRKQATAIEDFDFHISYL
jgi:hypothetical protein